MNDRAQYCKTCQISTNLFVYSKYSGIDGYSINQKENFTGRIKVRGMNVLTVKFFQLFQMLKLFIIKRWGKYVIVVIINVEYLSPNSYSCFKINF